MLESQHLIWWNRNNSAFSLEFKRKCTDVMLELENFSSVRFSDMPRFFFAFLFHPVTKHPQ